MFRGTKKLWAGATVAAMTFAGVAQSWAANGTWQGPSIDNDWDTTTNWVGGTIADGANFTANFTGPTTTPAAPVTVPFDLAAAIKKCKKKYPKGKKRKKCIRKAKAQAQA